MPRYVRRPDFLGPRYENCCEMAFKAVDAAFAAVHFPRGALFPDLWDIEEGDAATFEDLLRSKRKELPATSLNSFHIYHLSSEAVNYLMPVITRAALEIYDLEDAPADDSALVQSILSRLNDRHLFEGWNASQRTAVKQALQCLEIAGERCDYPLPEWAAVPVDPEFRRFLDEEG